MLITNGSGSPGIPTPGSIGTKDRYSRSRRRRRAGNWWWGHYGGVEGQRSHHLPSAWLDGHPTLLFFVGLFVLVGGLEVTGFVGDIAELLTGVAPGASATTELVVIWSSGLAAGIVDNIPFTATMIPVIQDLAEAERLSEAQTRSLWWALALGADFGSNLTLIGASANVVVARMSGRAGRGISFLKFLLYGIPVIPVSLVIATVYVSLRHYL
jgi:Na+/H+ antiporter NhaD/arsenite permease-like protein